MARARGSRKASAKPRLDGTRTIFWVNMLIVFGLVVLLLLGQFDFLLAGVLFLLVLNGLMGRRR